MTKEEIQNLKVGDVLRWEEGEDCTLEQVTLIISYDEVDTLVLWSSSEEYYEGLTSHLVNLENDYVQLEPLYDSPLYKAMSELEEE